MRDAIKQMNDKYRLCRLWGHPWEPTTVGREGSQYIQGLRCPRCETVRRVVINRWGHNLGNRYRHPKDYRVEGGLSTKEKNGLRLLEVKSHWQ